jgi:hypothetical protein
VILEQNGVGVSKAVGDKPSVAKLASPTAVALTDLSVSRLDSPMRFGSLISSELGEAFRVKRVTLAAGSIYSEFMLLNDHRLRSKKILTSGVLHFPAPQQSRY